MDDSPGFRGAAIELLVGNGFEVFAQAADGPEALAAVARDRPDGILLDVNLPGPNGFAVADALAEACADVRIVLTSADVDQVPARLLHACAATAFVPKQELVAADLDALFGV